MIEFLLSMTAFSWWIILLFCIAYFIIPCIKKMEFSNEYYKEINTQVKLGSDSQIKIENQEYFALCAELIKSWQWATKMKLGIAFQANGYSQINAYILSKFSTPDLSWIQILLNDDLSYEEKKSTAQLIKLVHYQTLKHVIKQDIYDDSI